MKISTKRRTVSGLRRHSGMTLTELLIVLAIVAMLTIVSYPSFMQSVRKSKRTDAQTALTRASAGLERHFAVNGTYTTDGSRLAPKRPSTHRWWISRGGSTRCMCRRLIAPATGLYQDTTRWKWI